jgi:hypothetical protein
MGIKLGAGIHYDVAVHTIRGFMMRGRGHVIDRT